MEINDLKLLIGRECVVINPRSKKNSYETATIIGANVSINKMRDSNELYC